MSNLSYFHHYALIVASVLYSSYISSRYLTTILPSIFAYGLAILLSVVAHLYLSEAMNGLRKKQLGVSLITSMILSGVIIWTDVNGVHSSTIGKMEADHTAANQQLTQQLSNFRAQLAQLTKAKSSWIDRANAVSMEKQIHALEVEQDRLKANQQRELESMQMKSDGIKGMSIALLVLSGLAAFALSSADNTKAIPRVREDEDPTSGSMEPDVGSLSISDRIELCKSYIQDTSIIDHRHLADRFRLNFQMVKQAKELAALAQAS